MGLACSLAGTAGAAPPSEAAPSEVQPPAEPQTAAEWYAHGYELGNAGDYEAAAAAFLRSYELKPTAEALFNAALAHEQAGATIEAIETYERFLAEAAPPPELVEAARVSIDALLPTVAVIKGLRYPPEQTPAEVYVGGKRVELDDFPRLVLPGEIEIEVVADSGARERESYELFAGEALIIDLRGLLPPPPEEPPPPELEVDEGPTPAELEAERARARRAATLRTVTWVGLGLTGATAIGAVTLGGLSLRERDLYGKTTCFQFDGDVCSSDFEIGDPESHLRAHGHYVRGGTILAGVSGGLAIATLVIGIVAVRASKALEVDATVMIVPTPTGFLLRF
jgi:hypothetical protein